MTAYVRIYGETTDTYGTNSNATYTTANAATTSTASNVAVTSAASVRNFFSGGTYTVAHSFLVFNTSALTGSYSNGTFSVNVSTFAGNVDADTMRIRQVSAIGNKIAGASLSGHTPIFADPGTFPTATGRYSLPVINISSIPATAAFQVCLHTVGNENGTVPTGSTGFSINFADNTGTTSDPYLNFVGGWTFVGVSAPVVVATTGHTLTEPAGVAAGDLLIATFSTRIASTTSMTLASGWTLVGEAKNNNVLTTASALPTGTMAYIVRGASAPALTFTHPTAPSQSIGQIVAYRGSATTTPLDAFTAVTTATATTAVSVAGLTTTQDDDLIVAMCAGGQEATWFSFNNVTAPIGASGSLDTTTAPSPTAWIERADSLDTSGADGSLGIFDAVRTGTGATGNLAVTASVSAGHVVIAGAFKIAPPLIADAWSANDKSANITLSDSDKTATTTSSSAAGIRSTTARTNGTAGKYYAELVMGATRFPRFGFIPTSEPLTTSSLTFYADTSSGSIFANTVVVGSIGSALASGDVCCAAWDAGAELVWFRKNGDPWNNSGTADPATGAGGISVSFAAASGHNLWTRAVASGASGTLRTELAEYTQAIPSGFTSWMGETPASGGITVNAVGVSAGSAVGTATVDTVASASFEAVGVAAGSAAGTVSVTAVVRADVTVDAVGVAAAAVVGTATVTAKSNVSTLAVGQSATAVAGEVSAAGKTNISTLATGQAAVSVAGTATVTARANVSVAASGVSAGTGVGAPGVESSGAISVSATSVAAASAVGEVSIVGKANVTTAGVAASALAGSPSLSGTAAITATGVAAAAQAGTGSVSTTQIVTVTPTGQAAAALAGGVSVAVGGGVSITPTGVTTAALEGTAAVSAIQVVTTAVAGHAATALVGSPSTSGTATVSAAGHAATALMGAASVATTREATIDATGVAAAALTGGVSIAVGGSVSVTPTGVTAAALAGTVGVTALQAAAIEPIGQAATVLVGNVLVSGSVSVLAEGQFVAAQVGTVPFATPIEIGGMNVWTGVGWADKPAKVWTGSVWAQKPVKVWNGSVWV